MTPKRTPPKAAASQRTVNDVQRELGEIANVLVSLAARVDRLTARLERSQRK